MLQYGPRRTSRFRPGAECPEKLRRIAGDYFDEDQLLRPVDRAIARREASSVSIFMVAVRTTGVFCRPGCPARTPRFENVTFFASAEEAARAGFRPCKRCRPSEPPGGEPDHVQQTQAERCKRCRPSEPPGGVPSWQAPLLEDLERDPARRRTDADLRRLGLDPSRVRRWFRARHGTTFHADQRARRLGLAIEEVREGASLDRAALDHGFESLSGFRDAWARLVGDAPRRSEGTPVLTLRRLDTPLGPMVAGATEAGVALLEFADPGRLEPQAEAVRRALGCLAAPGRHEWLDRLASELAEYFDGRLSAFSVPLILSGTPFQALAWEYLRTIPYGETRSYSEQARAIGRPSAVRAVGRANGQNRLAILVPCHRVVAADGRLRGYGGGLWRKQFLIDLERRQAPGAAAQAGAPAS
ncbi:bifunctional transcriptional activator/DNA repair enzyme AdaA [Tautonia sociabilis]|uniref:methylated-DNA--[protein]-cysteine S-methyltransferase n=1 Tax=Tautonia sociabilis TaxID=2080755 RepID=A0A432MR99_9BACT|nr:methylated-DNA--[protein]-cysteine S-methyltransferase [Tautonia sociabilis]RUL89779.1 methylated-DNA--[protein]-cysteine S-methyltransferase [Tautonia sociabilis]